MSWIGSASAQELGAKVSAGELSSAELLAAAVATNEAVGGPLNAVVATELVSSAKRASEADEAAARGESWGPLHGVPITLKDTWEVVGMTCTAGAPVFANHMPVSNADAAQRLLDAGAVVWGKTNTPLFANDIQTYNDVFGTTNNPWDTSRTPGGSSGGAAAALAAGITPLELGSDIGGSIRTPAHFCGVFGHKPTQDIVSERGHIPGPPGHLSPNGLSVAGPMARNAADLAMGLNVVAGPPLSEPAGWELNLPQPSARSLADLKVAVWYQDESAPIMGAMADGFRSRADALSDAGAQVTEVPLASMALEEFVEPYLRMLGPIVSEGMPQAILDASKDNAAVYAERYKNGEILTPFLATQLDGITVSHMDWSTLLEQRYQIRQRVIEFFDDFDVLLSPVVPVVAPPHNTDITFNERIIEVDGEKRSYFDQLLWISPATLCGLPSTSAPLGMVDGLPFNTQIIAKPFADLTAIKAAELMEEAFGGFEAPPGFEG